MLRRGIDPGHRSVRVKQDIIGKRARELKSVLQNNPESGWLIPCLRPAGPGRPGLPPPAKVAGSASRLPPTEAPWRPQDNGNENNRLFI